MGSFVSRAALPLEGLRVAVTRPAGTAGEVAELLEQAGAVPVLIPLTRILPPLDDSPLVHSAHRLEEYDWIVFTSATAVRALADAAARWKERVRGRIAAVGPATAAVVYALTGRQADVVPARFTADALVPAMLALGSLGGMRVLWPRGEAAGDRLPLELRRAGAVLDDPIAYRTLPDLPNARALADMAGRGKIDVITFAAPSAVESFAAVSAHPPRCVIAVIGPATAASARAHGLPVHVEPEAPMIPALVAALARFRDCGSQE